MKSVYFNSLSSSWDVHLRNAALDKASLPWQGCSYCPCGWNLVTWLLWFTLDFHLFLTSHLPFLSAWSSDGGFLSCLYECSQCYWVNWGFEANVILFHGNVLAASFWASFFKIMMLGTLGIGSNIELFCNTDFKEGGASFRVSQTGVINL